MAPIAAQPVDAHHGMLTELLQFFEGELVLDHMTGRRS
jgi:hypothetical protein